MAQSQRTAAKHRARRRHQTRSPSPTRHRDWDLRNDHVPHSLPYRPPAPEVPRPDGRDLNLYSHPGARLPDEIVVPDPMPHPQQQLARSAAVPARNGKSRAVYVEVEEDDDEDERMISRLRARSKSRPRTGSKPRTAISSDEEDEDDDETYELSTPPRSTPVTPQYRSRQTSRLPSPSSSRSSSVDSDSTVSTEDERTKRYAQRRRVEVPVTPPPPRVDRSESRQHRRRHREMSAHREDDSDDDEPEYTNAVRVRERSKSVPRPRQRIDLSRSASRSASRRPSRHQDRHDEGEPSSSTKRVHRRRYYESDVPYEKPKLPRAHTAPSSHVTSPSMSSSSRRSAAFLNRFMVAGHQSPRDKPRKTVECVVCLDDLLPAETAKLKCGHRMCKHCLKRSFKLSVKDPSQMPPRCCTSDCIPLKHVEDLFDVNFKKQWNRKYHEFSTRNCIYCPGKRCGRWIKPDQIQRHRNGRKVGKCGSCHTRVCYDCKNRWHGSTPCPADEETNQLLQQAKEEGWQRCYNCKNMVELKEGCNHMTCRCGAQFCMICGLKWKTCECPWFNYDATEDHLDHMQIPEPIIDRERLGLRTAPPAQRPRPNYEGEMYRRHLQEQHDEELARRLQFDDTEDDYMDPVEDLGMDNDVRHFMSKDYRRRARTVVAPPAPAPPPVAPFERTAASVVDYVSGVNRARGVRAGSMERRLADRFEQRQPGSPTPHMGFGHSIPPPPTPPRAMGPPLQSQPPLMQTPSLMRRHTVDDELYEPPHAQHIPERMRPRRASTRAYIDDPGVYERGPRVRRRAREASTSPKDSVLAGLTGPGRGMHRVYEWVNHVEADPMMV